MLGNFADLAKSRLVECHLANMKVTLVVQNVRTCNIDGIGAKQGEGM
jgi:hypothetical protein